MTLEIDEQMTWGDLFTTLLLRPGMPAKPSGLYSYAGFREKLGISRQGATVDERLSLMCGLLAPFFCPQISYSDAFEIARAGESSPLMFQVFQDRPQIMSVLHLCKRLKSAPVLFLASEGPKAIAEFVSELLQQGPRSDGDSLAALGDNFATYFGDSPAQVDAEAVQAYLRHSDSMPIPEVDLFAFVSALPAWSLISRKSHPVLWASRHDEVAVILKNSRAPGLEDRQRRAAGMMEEAIEVFEQQGADHDAAVAKSNLGNLIGEAQWLTVEERLRRAKLLYYSALESAKESEFRALLMDNIASQLGTMANLGLPVSRREALEMSMAAAEELEASENLARLPEILSNVVGHLAGLRDEKDSRREDLKRARDVGARALALVEGPANEILNRQMRADLLRSVADVLIRSADYEPDRVSEFAQEAIRLMDRASKQPDSRLIDSEYMRAKAQRLLGDLVGALTRLDGVLSAISPGNENPEFKFEVLRSRYDILSTLRGRGDMATIEAAESLAEHAQQNGLLSEWLFGETAVLEERLFASALSAGEADAPRIERAERVLAQVDPASDEALRLQCVLAGAYALRAVSTTDEDDLFKSVTLFDEIALSTPTVDRLVVVANILASWLQIAFTNFAADVTALGIADIAVSGLAWVEEVRASAIPGLVDTNVLEESAAICRMAVAYHEFLMTDSVSSGKPKMHRLAERLEQCVAEEETPAERPSNISKIAPILLEASAHAYAAAGLLARADSSYRSALDAASKGDMRHKNFAVAQIRESLYANVFAFRPADAVREIAATDATAGAWTNLIEKCADTPNEHITSSAQSALAAFEQDCFQRAVEDGRLRYPDPGVFDQSDDDIPPPDNVVSAPGMPKVDSVGFDVEPNQPLNSATTVLLLQGWKSGYALIVPARETLQNAVAIELPEYSSRVADRLVLESREGWVPSLLAWRSDRRQSTFDAAIRRTAVRLWDCVMGRVHEALTNLNCVSEVDLVVRGNQRLLPWGCAAPSSDLQGSVAETWKLSTGFDLGTLLLGQAREKRRAFSESPSRARGAGLTILMAAAPFLGIPIDTVTRLMSRPSSGLKMLSVTDGTGDLPMTRLEGDVARRAFPDSTIVHDGPIHPIAAPFMLPLMESSDIIHIACHGEWMPTHPWVSAVMLGPTFPLFAATVRARLHLDGPLVVLSACESGVGGPAWAGEGGLVQAFLLAGARTVVGASWMVNDLSSLVLAEAFWAEFARTDDVFASMDHARLATREMTMEALGTMVARWERERPDLCATLERSYKQAATVGDLPFSSPVHWGAQFIATTCRTEYQFGSA